MANLIRCRSLLEHLESGKVSQDDFDLDIHKAIIQGAKEVIRVSGGPDLDGIPIELLAIQLKRMIQSGTIFPQEKQALVDEVDTMYSMDLNPKYFGNDLPNFLSEMKMYRLVSGYKPGQARTFAASVAQALDTATSAEEDGCVIYSPLSNLYLAPAAAEVVPCGISSIDSRMSGGLGKGEFGVICAPSGLGKTTLAINICWGAAMTKRALLVTLEIPGPKIIERLYSRVTQIPYNRIRHGDENGDREVVNREIGQLISQVPNETKDNFQIWDYANSPCSLKLLDRRLARERDNGTLPDLVFLDWLDALETPPSDRNNGFVARELRHQLESYSRGCSDLAKKYNIAFWATTQANKGGENQRQIRMSNAAEGFSKAWRCSVFLGLGATDDDRMNNRMTVKAAKMRDGAIFETQIQARLDTQTFEDVPPDLAFAPAGAANFTPINDR